MTTSTLKEPIDSVEIYPYIIVYKNLFNDIAKTYSVLKESTEENEDRAFSNWTQWSIFGEYLNPVMPSFDGGAKYCNFENIVANTQAQKDQRELGLELMAGFYLATEDYISRYGIDVDLEAMSIDADGNPTPTWRKTGPTVAKYHISTEDNPVGMRYHSDYIREQTESPGYKFAITALAYYNDDYEGGEIDFCVGNKLIKYKPVAGDYVVFPAGHPDYLTEDGMVYLHGVMPSTGTHKYLSRLYWQKYYEGSSGWHEKEKEFGKTIWAGMQKDLEKEHRQKYPQRSEIKDGVRIG